MVNRYCIMYKYNSINHTNEKTEAFYCLKNNYDKEKTQYYTSSLSDVYKRQRMYSPLHKSPCRAMISPGSKCFKLFGSPNRKATNSSSFIHRKRLLLYHRRILPCCFLLQHEFHQHYNHVLLFVSDREEL